MFVWRRTETTDSWCSAGSSSSCMRRFTFDRSGLFFFGRHAEVLLTPECFSYNDRSQRLTRDLGVTFGAFVFFCACEIIRKGSEVVEKTQQWLWKSIQRRWSTVQAARGLYWTGSCSMCWTERGTSSVCSAASANVIWLRNAFLEKGNSIAKMTSLGKLVREVISLTVKTSDFVGVEMELS